MSQLKFKQVKELIKECSICGYEISGITEKQANQRLKLHQTSKNCLRMEQKHE